MKTSVIRKKRIKSGYSKIDMANQLNLNLKTYEEIESGRRIMPKDLFQKFNEIINIAKISPNIVKIQRAEKRMKVEKFREELSANNCEKLKELRRKFNISTNNELAELLGVSPSIVCNYVKNRTVSKEFEEKIYDFFNNELNIQLKDDSEFASSTKRIIKYADYALNEETRNGINEFIYKARTTKTKIANSCNIPVSTFVHTLNGRLVGIKTMNKIVNGIRKYAINNNLEEEFNNIPWNTNEKIEVALINLSNQNEEAQQPNIEVNETKEEAVEENVVMNEETIAINKDDFNFKKEEVEKTSNELKEEIQEKIKEFNLVKEREEKQAKENEYRQSMNDLASRVRIVKEEFIKEGFSEEFSEKVAYELFMSIAKITLT